MTVLSAPLLRLSSSQWRHRPVSVSQKSLHIRAKDKGCDYRQLRHAQQWHDNLAGDATCNHCFRSKRYYEGNIGRHLKRYVVVGWNVALAAKESMA